ncbi:MAG: hypothetical protein WAW69_18115 [Polaromonas sp.]
MLAEHRARGQVTAATRVPTGLFCTFKEEDAYCIDGSRSTLNSRDPLEPRVDVCGNLPK